MRDAYTSTRTLADLPRIPLKGSIDLTYRCNNRCRHCWVWTDKGEGELTKEEIFDIVDQARAMGCREWAISGGEPMQKKGKIEFYIRNIQVSGIGYPYPDNSNIIIDKIKYCNLGVL
jgi:organic radical activating enzyme